MQMLNPGIHVLKDGEWIASECKQMITSVEDATDAQCSGFIMDSAAANRRAFRILHEQHASPLITLQCATHTLSLLLKDIAKFFSWANDVYKFALQVSQDVNGSTKLMGVFEAYMEQQGKKKVLISRHCETRFGSMYMVMCSVQEAYPDLVRLTGSELFEKEEQASRTVLGGFRQMMERDKYHSTQKFTDMSKLLKQLCEPIVQGLHQVEADKAYLSRMYLLIKKLERHATTFCDGLSPEDQHLRVGTHKGQILLLPDVFKRRLRDFYYQPALAAAFLLDPVNFTVGDDGILMFPFEDIAEVQTDVVNDIQRVAGQQALHELSNARISGLQNLDFLVATKMKKWTRHVRQNESAVTFVPPTIPERIRAWKILATAGYPSLAVAATQYLSMHASSCAAERNLSLWGRTYDKLRNRLQLRRAEKMVFLTFNDKATERKDGDELLFDDLLLGVDTDNGCADPAVDMGIPDVPDAADFPDEDDGLLTPLLGDDA